MEAQHAGVASGVNNAVARVAGLIAIALFGIMLVRSFDAARPCGARPARTAGRRAAAIDRELPKLAGAEIRSLEPDGRGAARRAIDDSFVLSFGLIMNVAAGVALGAAAAGVLIREPRSLQSTRSA